MSTEIYLPVELAPKIRRQAMWVWLGGLSIVLAWILLIIAAPLARVNGFESLASGLYQFFRFACHQISERSFHVEGEQFAVCSRCFGVYFGLLIGFVIYPMWRAI